MATVRWSLFSPDYLVWRTWDEDEHVLYHTCTGDTHILSDVAAELLDLLEVKDLTSLELSNLCAATFGIEPDESFRQHVAEALKQFDDLGLVELAS